MTAKKLIKELDRKWSEVETSNERWVIEAVRERLAEGAISTRMALHSLSVNGITI